MKYVPGLMVGQLSGKAGSTVASRNKGGSYFRTRVIPKHVVNALTSAVRANFGANAQAFRSLTDSQRLAWSSLGAQITTKTSLGETIHLTGLQALQLINRNLYTAQLSASYDAPAFASAPALTEVDVAASAGVSHTTTVTTGADSAAQVVGSTSNMFVGQTLLFALSGLYRQVASITDGTHVVLTEPIATTTAENIDFTGIPVVTLTITTDPIPIGSVCVFDVTAPLSAGVSRPSRGQFRQIAVATGGESGPVDIALAYVQQFGQPDVNTKIFARAKMMTTTGFAGPEVAGFAIVG